MQVIWDTARRELLHLRRDRRLLILLLMAPPLLTVLFGFAFESNAITDMPLAVFDEDDSPASREMVAAWRDMRAPGVANPLFRIDMRKGGPAEARAALNGHYWGAVHVPAGFAANLGTGDPPRLRRSRMTLLLDGSDTIAAPYIRSVLAEAVGRFNRAAAEDILEGFRKRFPPATALLDKPTAEAIAGPVDLDVGAYLYNPDLNFLSYMLPGILGMVLMLMTVTPLAASIAGERESGTLEQIAVSPASGAALLLGKALPYCLPAAFDVLCVAAVARLLFGLSPNGGIWLLVACAAVFVPAALATAALIGAVSRTRMQAIQTAVFYLMPALLLSGAYAPLESIPESVRWVSNAFPLTFFCRAFRAVWFRGFDVDEVAMDLAGLAGFALAAFAAAALLFRMRRT